MKKEEAERKCGKCQKVISKGGKTQVGLCKDCLEALENWQRDSVTRVRASVGDMASHRRSRNSRHA